MILSIKKIQAFSHNSRTTESITDKGPKNIRANEEIPSARYALGFTMICVDFFIHIKHSSQFLLKEYLSGKIVRNT